MNLNNFNKIAVLTGAGISAESGISTFRGADGLWKNFSPVELATPQAFASNPELVWEWYLMRLNTVLNAKPNKAHYLLADLGKNKDLTIVTQNVDQLHQRSGSEHVLELHGNITHSRCLQCANLDELDKGLKTQPKCSKCQADTRPNVVWFGESLPTSIFQNAINAFKNCDLAIIIGTSGVVEPAAGLATIAKNNGAYLLEINPEQTPISRIADLSIRTTASQGLEEVLANMNEN